MRLLNGSATASNPDVSVGHFVQNVEACKMINGCPDCGSMKTIEIKEKKNW